MSKLLNNPNLKNNKNSPLDRRNDIKPNSTFSLDELNTANNENKKPSTDSVTFYANVRINNHIKNKAEALSSIGLYKSQKDAIEAALDYLIDGLSTSDKRKLQFQLETLEERDVRIKNK